MTPEAWIALAGVALAAASAFFGGYVGLVTMISRSRNTLRNEMHVELDKLEGKLDRLEDRFNARFGGD